MVKYKKDLYLGILCFFFFSLWVSLLGQEMKQIQSALLQRAREAAPYVVKIEVQRDASWQEDLPPGYILFQDVEKLPWPNKKLKIKDILKKKLKLRPLGSVSGMIISSQGEILTSAYNVEGKIEKITVTLSNGKTFLAQVIAKSYADDLALLKIDSRTKAPVALKSDLFEQPKVGAWSIVLGRGSKDASLSVHYGIISSLGSTSKSSWQIDAKVNHHNTGGAVFSIKGELLGLVHRTSHYSKIRPSSGVGFVLPLSEIQRLLKQLRQGVNIPRKKKPYLGVRVEGSLKKGGYRWMEVAGVFPDSPAWHGGVYPYDLIQKVNGKSIRNKVHFQGMIESCRIGETIFLSLLRQDMEIEMEIVLGKAWY